MEISDHNFYLSEKLSHVVLQMQQDWLGLQYLNIYAFIKYCITTRVQYWLGLFAYPPQGKKRIMAEQPGKLDGHDGEDDDDVA